MWNFAADHPVWFFVYLSTCCLTLVLVSQAIAWAIKGAAEAASCNGPEEEGEGADIRSIRD